MLSKGTKKKMGRAFKSNFSIVSRWDPGSFHSIHWRWPALDMHGMNEILIPRKEKVDRSSVIYSDLMPVTIHFDGSIEPRRISDSSEYSMELFWIRPGDIVASKIDLKNGALAIVPQNWNDAVVTNHFAVYEPDLDRVNPIYFHMLVQARFFKEYLWRNKVGAEGRKEVKLKFFEGIEIPLPDIAVQTRIVDYWEKALHENRNAKESLSNLINEISTLLEQKTSHFHELTASKVVKANYAKIRQWDSKAGRAAAFITANPDFIRLGDFTEEGIESVRASDEPEKEWPIYGVNNKTGVFLSTMQLGKDFNMPYKKIERDYFFHNPTRANVGSLGIVGDVPEDAITSPEYQVWKLTGGFLPDFMALLIRTKYFLSLVAFNRVGGVKQRMYYANLAEIRLPMIEMSVQRDFARRRKDILAQIDSAKAELAKRKIEIEEMILGTRPVPS